MFIELIDLLRCPVEHEETWLVASFSRMEGRFVIEGKLGCPICNAEYEIRNGVAEFGDSIHAESPSTTDDDAVVRTAALLNLTRPGSLAVLFGKEASVANRVSEMTQARIIAINPDSAVEESELVGIVTAGSRIPLASLSVDAIALAENGDFVQDAVRVMKPGARITARPTVELASRFTVLASDERSVVAESPGAFIPLKRGAKDPG